MDEKIIVSLNLQGIAFWVSDKDGKCIYASSCLCRLLGRTESEILDENWSNYLVERDKERVWQAWEIFVDSDKSFDERYSYINGVDGTEILIHGRAFKIKSTGIIMGALTKVHGNNI